MFAEPGQCVLADHAGLPTRGCTVRENLEKKKYQGERNIRARVTNALGEYRTFQLLPTGRRGLEPSLVSHWDDRPCGNQGFTCCNFCLALAGQNDRSTLKNAR